jgi:hypothetical protein
VALNQNLSAIICADWGKERGKRAVYVADVAARTIRRLHGNDWSFSAVLQAACPWTDRGAVLVTFDAPLGVPGSYMEAASKSLLWNGPRTFPEFVRCVWSDPGYFDMTVTAQDWTVERPFFAVPSGVGGLTAFSTAAAHFGIDLFRVVDRQTKAKTVFAKSGIPGSVGSAACALWKEIGRNLTSNRTFRIWPFDGTLEALIIMGRVIIGEIYPRAAYATALLDVPAVVRPPLAVAKTNAAVRGAAIQKLLRTDWVKTQSVVLRDLDAALHNEDDFDACFTAAALLRSVLEGKPLARLVSPSHPAEGGMIGTAEINLSLSEKTFRQELQLEKTVDLSILQSRGDREVRYERRPELYRQTDESRHFQCPIAGCEKVFHSSRGGWDGHVSSHRIHPEWCPQLRSEEERRRQFRLHFPNFFED